MYSDKVDAIQEMLVCDCDDGKRQVLPAGGFSLFPTPALELLPKHLLLSQSVWTIQPNQYHINGSH